MSAEQHHSHPQVSDHAMWRFMERGDTAASYFDVQTAWREGYQVDVPGKTYFEARYVVVRGSELVLLRKGTHITTAICAPQETVSFVGTPPALVCSCGTRHRTRVLEDCPECDGRSWTSTEVPN